MSKYRNKKQQQGLCDKLWLNAKALRVEELITTTEYNILETIGRKAKARVLKNE